MTRQATLRISLIAPLLACFGHAHAADFVLSGFGTLGGAKTSTDTMAYVTNSSVSGGARKDFEFIDNRLAIQGDWYLNEQLSFMVQVMSRRGYDNSYRPRTEWAYGKYQLTPQFSVRAGRFYPTSFINSDYSHVGYAQLATRPAVGIYGPRLSHLPGNGMDMTWKTEIAEMRYTLNGGKVATHIHNYDGSHARSDDSIWFAGSLEQGDWLGRLSYTWGHSKRTHPGFQATTRQIEALGQLPGNPYPQAGAYAQSLRDTMDHIRYGFFGLGGAYDDGTWQIQSEWTRLRFDNPLLTAANNTGLYVTAGRRFGQLTPYVSYMRNRKNGSSDPAAPTWLEATTPNLAGIVNAYPAIDQSQHSLSFGTRWDFMKNMALKLQYDRVIVDGNVGMFFRGRPNQFPAGNDRRVNVLSAVVDFVF